MPRLYSLLLAMTALCLPLTAQADSGFPSGFNASTGGIRIGDHPPAVAEHLDQLIASWNVASTETQASNSAITTSVIRTTGSLPTETEGEVFPAVDGATLLNTRPGPTIASPLRREYRDTLSAAFGSPAVGGGVQTLYRVQYFPEPLDLRSFLTSVEETYGVPHVARGNLILYGFKDGAPITSDVMLHERNQRLTPEQIIRACIDPKTSPRNFPLPLNIDSAPPAFAIDGYTESNWHKPRKHPQVARTAATCDAALGLQFGVDKSKNVIWLVTNVTDIRAIMADLEATAGWFPPAAPKTGSKIVPKL